jgi:hypothetical protein
MGSSCSIHGEGEKLMYDFGRETSKEETTWKTKIEE